MPLKASSTSTFPFCSAIVKIGPRASHCWGFWITDDYTHTQTQGRTHLNERSARHRDNYPYNTQQTQATFVHAHSGTQTSDHGNQAASVLPLRPHGHQDKQFYTYTWLMKRHITKTLYNATIANNYWISDTL